MECGPYARKSNREICRKAKYQRSHAGNGGCSSDQVAANSYSVLDDSSSVVDY